MLPLWRRQKGGGGQERANAPNVIQIGAVFPDCHKNHFLSEVYICNQGRFIMKTIIDLSLWYYYVFGKIYRIMYNLIFTAPRKILLSSYDTSGKNTACATALNRVNTVNTV